MEREASILEAIFYLEAEPVDVATLARIACILPDAVEAALPLLQARYSEQASGIELVEKAGLWSIRPKREVWEVIKTRYGKKNAGQLSRAAMETLAIIAYSQPITRAEIEAIRGVSADTMIRALIERDLIKEVGKKDVVGKPVQFGTTAEFLKFFHLNSIADLPKLEEAERERFELAR